MASLKRKTQDSPMDPSKKTKSTAITSFFGAKDPNSPKAATSTAPTPKFNKDKWVAGLTPEQKGLLKLEIDTLDESWLAHLKDEVVTRDFLDLKRFLKSEAENKVTVYPPMSEVYSWSRHTPLHKVKAVILGQDPYHNVNQAHGLCFSVRPPTPAPPSLKNIYTALKKDYPSFKPPPNNRGLLTPWAESGVLLLNTCLTVRAHEANSHSNKGWERFTQKVIETVAKVRTRGVVFLAWGSPAQKRCTGVEKGGKHIVLRSVHPSPLSAHKGFMDCGHFKKTNDWLEQRYGVDEIINWDLNNPKPILKTEPVKVAESAEEVKQKDKKVGANGTATPSASQSSTTFDDNDEDDDAVEAMNGIIAAEAEATPSLKGTPEEDVKNVVMEKNAEQGTGGNEINTTEASLEVKNGEETKEETVVTDVAPNEESRVERESSAD
ncbi:MAG: hypothetical protein Q9160_009019 [Pyrenula sp. 1 TL-2023]